MWAKRLTYKQKNIFEISARKNERLLYITRFFVYLSVTHRRIQAKGLIFIFFKKK